MTMNLNEVGYYIPISDADHDMFEVYNVYVHGNFLMSTPYAGEAEAALMDSQLNEYDEAGNFVIGFTPESISVYIQFDIVDENTNGMVLYTNFFK